MAAETLDLTIRRRADGLRWPPIRIVADPADAPELLRHLAEHARRLDRRDSGTGWLAEYDAEVVPVKHTGARFTIAGIARAGES